MQEGGIYDWHNLPRKKRAVQVIAEVGPDSTKGTVPALVPRTFEIRGASVCDGDSGGPPLSAKAGAGGGGDSHPARFYCARPHSPHTYTNMSTFGWLAADAVSAGWALPPPAPPAPLTGGV